MPFYYTVTVVRHDHAFHPRYHSFAVEFVRVLVIIQPKSDFSLLPIDFHAEHRTLLVQIQFMTSAE
jgi:hypothetical protein